MVLRVTSGPPAAHADIQITVRAKGQLATVVVGVRLGNGQHDLFAVWICHIGIGRCVIAGNYSTPGFVRIVHVEMALVHVAGRERHAQQTPLAAAANTFGNVEEGSAEQHSCLENPDAAALLDDEQPPASVKSAGDL